MSEMRQMRRKSDVAPVPTGGWVHSDLALTQKSLALNKEADDQCRKSKHRQNAAEYRHQPNGPATVVLDNLRGYIGEVSPRHGTSFKTIEVHLSAALQRRLVALHTAQFTIPQIGDHPVIRAAQKSQARARKTNSNVCDLCE